MKERIVRAVAMPPKLFWAPMAPAGANLGIQLPMILFVQTFSDMNPLFIVASVVLAHIGIIIMGIREPHLSKMMESQGRFMVSYKSMYSHKGRNLSS